MPTHFPVRVLLSIPALCLCLSLGASCSKDKEDTLPLATGGGAPLGGASNASAGDAGKQSVEAASGTNGGNTDCGGPGEACCEDNTCASGCCVSGYCRVVGQDCGGDFGECEADGTCTNCGAADEACCPGGVCEASLACRGPGPIDGGTCESCGKVDELCCSGDACNEGTCVCGACRTGCGTEGEDCCACDAGVGFSDPGSAEMGCLDGLACVEGDCDPCGGADQPCCPGNVCDEALGCVDGSCQECGKPEQPCCEIPGGDGCPGPINTCNNGTCEGEYCGAYEGEPCCDGDDPCSDEMGCVEGKCAACGGEGEACCETAEAGEACRGNSVCVNALCEPCGGEGDVCCAGEICFGPGLSCVNAACTAG